MRFRRAAFALVALAAFPFAPRATAPARSGRDHTVQNYMIPMSDGVRLNTDVALPSGGSGPFPVMLYRTPYNIQDTNVDGMADVGYAGVSQDTRGRFGSEGIDRMFRDEGYGPDNRDGLETVQWILRQPWCNGRIATWGGSASAINENLLAAALPDSVRCMITYYAAADLYQDLVFPGGAFKQIDIETWLHNQGSDWNLDSIYAHPDHDGYWSWLDTTPRLSRETIPTYQIGGWFDIFPDGPIHSFTGLQYGGGPGAAGRQKLIMGPWVHGGDGSPAGQLTFPNSSADDAQALIGSLWDWLNHWIFDQPNGIMNRPPVAYYVMGDVDTPGAPGNEWRTTWVWPPPATTTTLYLTAAGGLSPVSPGGAEPPETFAYDPRNPVPTLGGGNLVIAAGSYDQRPVLDRSDVLVYRTPLLAAPCEVTGTIQVELYVSSDRLDTDFTAKLCDVYPDGRAMLITDGILRARHRLRMDGEDLLVPGQVVPISIELPETAIAFNAGHRILVAVSSSNSPRFDANPNTGEPFMHATTTLVAHNTVYHDMAHRSRVLLPVTGTVPTSVPGGAGGAGVVAGATRVSAAPNPFMTRTALRITLDAPGHVEVRIVDAGGRLVRVLADAEYAGGAYEVAWDGTSADGRAVPPGVYRYLVSAAGERRAGTIIRLK